MKRTANVCIDHVTIYCKDKEPLNKLFSSLGFFSKNGVHYMSRNSYFELYQPKSPEETYPFFHSEAGLHSFIFWSDDIDNCYERVTGAGYVTAMPVSEFSRPADHGEPQGEAHFRGFYMQSPLLPIGETAIVQQMNLELIYPAKPYPHPNGLVKMDKMYLCLEGDMAQAETAEALTRFCGIVGEGRPEHDCVSTLEIGSQVDFAKSYGVTVDPERSCCTGIRFLVADLNAARKFIEGSGLSWCENAEGELCVDASAQANLFLVFAQL